MELRFFDDPAAFLDVAGPHLAAEPVLSTVIAGHRASRIARPARGRHRLAATDVPCWFAAVARRAARSSATAMRTAPFAPHPLYLLPMPDEAVRPAAPRRCTPAASRSPGANGALPAVQVFCEDDGCRDRRQARVGQHTRLFELGDLVEPRPVPAGCARPRSDERRWSLSWYDAFMADADEQAGREPGESPHESPDRRRHAAPDRRAAGSGSGWTTTTGRST